MRKILLALALVIMPSVALADGYSNSSITPPCTAFGTTTGTCIQGAGNAGTPSAIVLSNATLLPDSALSANVPLLNASNVFSGATNTITGFLDSSNGSTTGSIQIGADTSATTRTNSANKFGAIKFYPYTNANPATVLVFGQSLVAANIVGIGGGNGNLNAATEIDFYAAANTNTTTGTQIEQITTAGVAIKGSSQLSVAAMTQTSAAQSGTICYNSGTGAITYDATLGCLTSLPEFKDFHGRIEGALDELRMIKSYWISWKHSTPEWIGGDHEIQPAFNAREVALVDKRLVSFGRDGKLRGVRYAEMVAFLVAAVQDQEGEISAISAENTHLRTVADNQADALRQINLRLNHIEHHRIRQARN